MNKKILWVGVVVLALAVAGGGWYAWQRQHVRPTELVLSGNVDIREVTLAFRVGGRVRSVDVDEGAVVRPGQVLAMLDSMPLRNALAEAEAGVQAAQSRQALTRAGNRPEDVAQAKAGWDARQAALTNAEVALRRQQQLAGTGAMPQRALDDARAARDEAAAQAEAARQQYRVLARGFRAEDIAQAQAELALAQARLASARLALEDGALKAASGGVVLTRAVETGSMVSAGTPAFVISLNDPVWVRAYVEESALGKVAPGTKVRVTTDGGRTYDGVVGFVSPVAEFTPKQVETQDLRTALVYRLRIVMTRPDNGLRQGMPVTVRLGEGTAS